MSEGYFVVSCSCFVVILLFVVTWRSCLLLLDLLMTCDGIAGNGGLIFSFDDFKTVLSCGSLATLRTFSLAIVGYPPGMTGNGEVVALMNHQELD